MPTNTDHSVSEGEEKKENEQTCGIACLHEKALFNTMKKHIVVIFDFAKLQKVLCRTRAFLREQIDDKIALKKKKKKKIRGD